MRPLPFLGLIGALGLGACEREQRRFQELAPAASPAESQSFSELRPGEPPPMPPTARPSLPGTYVESAWAVSEGQRLYQWFNCVGCHAHGGGDIGPPLMDALWRYGSEPENIYGSIVQGRPNGMPSFRGKIPEQQVWQLVAYVRSLSGLVPKASAPGRADEMSAHPPETVKDREPPRPQPVEHLE